MSIEIQLATVADAEAILALQRLAYQSEAALHERLQLVYLEKPVAG